MELTDSIMIIGDKAAVFDAISQLDQMGRFSPENTGGTWLKGATGPAVGAKFKGTNSRDGDTWSTVATVRDYEPPSRSAFDVTYGPLKISSWEFTIEPDGDGVRLTERWVDRRGRLVRWQAARGGEDDREEFTATSLSETLAAVKQFIEAGATSDPGAA